MKPIEDSDPTTFKCITGEIITVRFAPNPSNALSVITYCFKQSCSKDDQQQVVGSQFSFTANQSKMLLQIFFFFIPGQPLGKCDILFTSSTGETYVEPVTVKELTTGEIPRKIYIFEAE
jgi:hypothetical protein